MIRGTSASVGGRSRTRSSSSTGIGHHVVRGRPSSVAAARRARRRAARRGAGSTAGCSPVEGEAAGVRHPPRREVARLRLPVHHRQPGLLERPAHGQPHRPRHVAAPAGPGREDVADLGRVPAEVDGAREPGRAAVVGLDGPARRRRAVLAGLGHPLLGVPPLVGVRDRGVRDGVGIAAHHHHVVDVVRPERSEGDDAVGAHGCDRGHRTMIGLVVRGGDGFALRPARGSATLQR